jgi:hypothetical protein
VDFVKSAVLSKGKVRDFMEEMWAKILATHPQTTRHYFDEFATNLWTGWVREKKKTANRYVSGVRRTRGTSSPKRGSHAREVVSVKPDAASALPQQSTSPTGPPSTSSVADIFQSHGYSSIVSDNMSITPFQSPNVSGARNDTLMSPPSIISRSDDSPSTSYSLTSRKRSIEQMEPHSPLSASRPERGNPVIEEYLLRELTKQIREGWLSPEGVKRVLENLETERHPEVESNVSLQDSKGEKLSGIPLLFCFTDYRTDCCHSPSGFPCCGEFGAIGFNARY